MPGSAKIVLKRIVFVFMRIKYGNILFQKDAETKKAAKRIIDEIVGKLSEEEAKKKLNTINEKIATEERFAKQVLIEMSKERNEKAFEILKKDYMKATFKIIRNTDYDMGKNKNYVEIEETAQEVWIKIWKSIRSYDAEQAEFMTWITPVIVNKIKDRYGTKQKQFQKKTDFISESNEDSDESKIDFDTKAYNMSKKAFKSADIIFQNEYRGELIFREVFKNRNGYPWQLLIFSIKMDLPPREIVERYSEDLLLEIAEEVKHDLISYFIIEDETIEEDFKELEGLLDSKLGLVILSNDARTKKKLEKMLNDKTGTIHLREFFGKEPTKNISDWCKRVGERLRKNLKANWR